MGVLVYCVPIDMLFRHRRYSLYLVCTDFSALPCNPVDTLKAK